GARVENQPFFGYGPKKRCVVELARHDWILSLDADERLDDGAAAAVRLLALDDPTASYAFRRRTFVGRREIHHGPWGGEQVVRLFNRRTGEITALAVHERVVAPGQPRLLAGSILHHGFPTAADIILRAVRYAHPKAGLIRAAGERPRVWALPWRAAGAFAKAYVLQSGWRDGAAGFVIALSRVVDSTLPRALLLLGDDPATPDQTPRTAASKAAMSAGSGASNASRSPDAG
ncbi:MAG: glycosyltransferase family 2 protein, partial [Planctomycetota bacterium]